MRKTSNVLSVDEATANATTELGADSARVLLDVPKAAASGRLHTLTADELEAVSQLSRQRDSDRPTAPAHSGAFARDASGRARGLSALRPDSQPPTAAHEPVRSALEAFYGVLPPPPERAEIRIDDLTLDFDNPFLASSLSPPPPRSRKPWLILGGLGGALALVAAGYLVAVFQSDSPWLAASQAPIQTVIAASSRPPELVARLSEAALEAERVAPAQAAEPTLVPPAQPAAPAASATIAAPTEAVPLLTAAAVQPTASPAPAAAPVPSVVPASPASARIERTAAPAPRVMPKLPPPARVPAVAPALGAKTAQARTPQPASVAQPVDPAHMPAQPSRTDVKAAMDGVRAALEKCAAGAQGRVTADIAISGAGKVTYALIEGAFAGTPQGSCMARALRGAQFPQFSTPSLRVRYPFVF